MRHPNYIGVQVVADRLTVRETECLEDAVTTVNGLQSQFVVREVLRKIELPATRALVKQRASFDALERRAKKDRVFCVTPRRFRGNEFQTANERCSLLTIDDWEDNYAPPGLETYLIYQFAFAFVCWAANHASDNALTHEDTRGCRMDFCENKDDIKRGMMAGYLCGECADEMERLGASKRQIEAIRRILHYVHTAATGCREQVNWDEAFVVMRFQPGSEHQRAFEEAIRPALEAVGIQVTRGDDLVQSRPILEKLLEQMKRARFIVAKVDAKRMNIFYELGFAMGANKDVLLISTDKDFDLPSDLSNWECLIYRTGDYGGLKDEIIKFFENNYHRQRYKMTSTTSQHGVVSG